MNTEITPHQRLVVPVESINVSILEIALEILRREGQVLITLGQGSDRYNVPTLAQIWPIRGSK